MTKIKICGLKRTEDISYVNELLPDFAGFVFAKSSRQVDAKKTAELKKQLSPKIKAVGVFVNAEPEFIDKLYQKQIIDLAQLHGDETADYIHRLKNLCPSLPLIKAVRVQSTKQILETEKLPCDYLLLDTWQKDSYGGSGKTFDRSLIPPLAKPWFRKRWDQGTVKCFAASAVRILLPGIEQQIIAWKLFCLQDLLRALYANGFDQREGRA